MDVEMNSHSYRTLDVPVAGGDLHVGVWNPIPEAEGETEATPTVLAIYGVTSSHLAWPFVAAELPGVRVIAPDLRGRGASRTLSGPAGMAAHATDLVAVLDALEVAAVPVIGHSTGAFVAVVHAHLYPDQLQCLALGDGGLPLDVPNGLSLRRWRRSSLVPKRNDCHAAGKTLTSTPTCSGVLPRVQRGPE